MLSEVSLIKDRQEDLDGKLDTMKNENEALWREVGVLNIPLNTRVFIPFISVGVSNIPLNTNVFTPVISNLGAEPSSEAHPAAEDC